ncbi:glutamine amidotransferase-related protein [Saccharopolyspora taberi]|uniref:Glutamine amidotransferase domain-containing protein n=1 Tax=Saccharopolyspora taberi TaxID=60895 RepID=A0ABN3VG35_9PSEU
MRTLLIDSYDSYVYNLAHLIADVSGAEPVVVQLKDLDSPDAIAGFDNVVVSGGSGRSDRSADFAALVRAAGSAVPVLGLGLREIPGSRGRHSRFEGSVSGHGRLSRVSHYGAEMFSGVPDEFTAVCGPSFQLPDPLPEELRVAARDGDGGVVAVVHRDLPQWWAQLHPESILTEHGARLIENFNALTRRVAGGVRSVPAPRAPLTAPIGSAQEAPGRLVHQCHVRIVDRRVDRAAVFEELFADAGHRCWLDFDNSGAGEPRFSVLAGGGPLSELISGRPGEPPVVAFADGRADERVEGSVFDHIGRELSRRAVLAPELPFEFAGGYLGWHAADTGETDWLFADRMVVVDHLSSTTYVMCLSADSPVEPEAARQWCDAAVAAIRRLPGEPVDGRSGSHLANLRLDGAEIACSALERVVRVDADGWVEARTAVAPADGEGLLTVDLLRNELGRVCSVGTVSVPDLMDADDRAEVVPTVRGRLRAGAGAIDAVRAVLSTAGDQRGFVGWFSSTGAAHLKSADLVVERSGHDGTTVLDTAAK